MDRESDKTRSYGVHPHWSGNIDRNPNIYLKAQRAQLSRGLTWLTDPFSIFIYYVYLDSQSNKPQMIFVLSPKYADIRD